MRPEELETLLRMWFPVARVEDVRDDRPFAAELLGRRLVVYRSDGSTAVAIDRCPHRGARLSNGRMREGTLECPYHGWRWDSSGACALVPSQPSAHPAAALDAFPVAERLGLVWTRLVEPSAGPWDEPLWAPPSIPETESAGDGWRFAGGQWFDVACGLRSITENFRDSSHFAFVHRNTFGDVNPEVPAYGVERDGWRLSWTIRLTFGSQWSVDGEGGRAASKYRFGETDGHDRMPHHAAEEEMVLRYRFTVPSLAYVFTEHEEDGRRLVAQAVAPLDVDGHRTRVFWFVAANEPFCRRFGPLKTQLAIEAQVFAEDVPIVEGLDPVEAPLDLDGQAHVRADRYSVAYRRLYAGLIDAAAPLTHEGPRR
jgi:phenylpropionate dioxygenase-like ring-hydroxylating dioxygenase large terminal subunit